MTSATGGDTPNEPARTIPTWPVRFETAILSHEMLVRLLDTTVEAIELRVGKGERIDLAEIEPANWLLGRLTDLGTELRALLEERGGGR